MPTTRTSEPEERFHAKLSPSGSKQWLNCADSLNVNKSRGGSNFYADEGTAAHELLDVVLRLDADPNRFLGLPIFKDIEVTDEMAEAVGQATDFINSYMVRNPNAVLHLDKEVDPHALLKCPPRYASGTGDVFIDNAPHQLVAIDYKHGAGVFVEVMDNTQLLQYLLGFYAQHATRPYKEYVLIIIQPRNTNADGPVRQHVITHEELMAHADRLRKRIKEIKTNPYQRAAGEWCTFCEAKGTCRTLAEHSLKIAQMEFGDMTKKPPEAQNLTMSEIEFVITHAALIEKWIAAVYAEAMKLLLKGKKSKVLKLVHGRTVRYWSDDQQVIKILKKMKFDEDEITPRSLLGVAKIIHAFKRRLAEKGLRGKAAQAQLPKVMKSLLPLIQVKEPGLHVAHIDDKRPAVKRGEEFLAAPIAEKKNTPTAAKKTVKKTRKA